MWVEKEMPLVEGLESNDSLKAKRWMDFYLNELLDDREPVMKQAKNLATRWDVCRFVIEQIDYPLVRGIPTDKHRDNWFGGLCCHTISPDFWQQASETIRTLRLGQANNKNGYGDCEDASILFVDLFLINGWEAFECFGEVYEGGELLGGHGWAIFEDAPSTWRLYEATLDTPPVYPGGYPIIDPERTEWMLGGLTYSAQVKFNKDRYYESGDGMLSGYLALRLKETKRKYKALQRAWQVSVKPIARGGILGRLRRF